MHLTLEKLADESPVFKKILDHETTYANEVRSFYPVYQPNVLGRLKSIITSPDYDKERLSQIVTDINVLGSHYNIWGQLLFGGRQLHPIDDILIQPGYTTRRYNKLKAAVAAIAGMAVGKYITESKDVDLQFGPWILGGVAVFGIGLIAFHLIDDYANSDYTRLGTTASRVDDRLAGDGLVDTKKFPHIIF